MTILIENDLVVTTCAYHGVKVCRDMPSMRAYVEVANACASLPPHADEHRANGEDCWVCCRHMVIDPHGVCD